MESNHTTASSSPMDTLTLLQLSKELHALELLLALAIFVAISSLHQRKRQGLAVWPLVGMLPSLVLGLCQNMYEWITDILHQQGGTFIFKGPAFTNLHCVVTSDPRNLEHLLKTKFTSFPKGPYFRNTVRDVLGDGIFNTDDEPWRRQRKAASTEFHSAKFRAMEASTLLELVHRRLLPVLEDARNTGTALDLQDVLLRLTFDNVCMIAFGADPGCLQEGLPEIPFAKDFEDATAATVVRFVTPTAIWKAMRFLQLGHERTLRRALRGLDDFAYDVIRRRKEEVAADPDGVARPDLLTNFMKMTGEDGEPFTDKFLRDVCVNFILAGRDTSSVALAWFFWLLDGHPEVEEKVLEELCGLLRERGHDGDEVGEDVVFTPEEVRKMEYLQAALSEALRLYPSVPIDHKEVIEDEVFPDGTVLKKGTKVLYVMYTMGRTESIWGPDCRQFKPERWMHEGRFMTESAYRFTAFNGGPRLCLGKEFAYYQMKFVAASVLYRYRVRVVKGHVVEPKLALTMYMKHGLKVTLEKRPESELKRLMSRN